MAQEMQPSKALAFSALMVLTAGCDSAFRIKGTAPEDSSCLVKVFKDEAEEPYEVTPVKGPFLETVIFGGLGAPEFAVVAECNGRAVKTFLHLQPSYEEPIDLGRLEP